MRCYTASWVLPVVAPPIRNGALLVETDGMIAAVGPIESMPPAEQAERVDLGNAILLPGLINVHAHPDLGAFRGILDDLPFHEWLPALMHCKRRADLTFEDFVVSARWTCIESLRTGVTTLGATEDSGASIVALAQSKMRGLVYLEVFGPAPEQAEASLRSLAEKVEHWRGMTNERVGVGVSPHAPYTISDPLYRAVAQYARAERLPIALHAAEAEAEALLVNEGVGPFAAGLRTRGIATPVRASSTIQLLVRNGIMDCAPLLIHAVRMSGEDIRCAADAGATVAHCPIANARLGHGIAPVVEMRAAGITVAIGTDSVASNNRLDMLEEARVAQLLQRGRLQSASALPSEDLLRMVTIDAARVLGLSARVGSLEPGKDADFCVVSLEPPHNVPAPDPVGALFHSARGTDVVMTAVRGEILYANGSVLIADEKNLKQKIEQISARLQSAREAK
jgi:cytosine/adenosine deaminase-related metal-dependent hydrolase